MSGTSTYGGCRFPEDLLYDLENHVWAKADADVVTIGATDPGQAYAGEIIFIKIKEPGTIIAKGAIVATIESAKYMGPMRSPVSGTVLEVNPVVKSDPTTINKDAYSTSVARIRGSNLSAELGQLTPGAQATEKYKPILDEWGIECKSG